jgi:nicotinamide phosphoribosyltransferase
MTYLDPIFACDFYKTGHKAMYPTGTTKIYSNFTPRSNRHCAYGADKIVFFGLQGLIKQWLIESFTNDFFNKPKEQVIAKYKRRMETSIGGEVDVSHIEALHDLGYLPLEIKALPEGSLVGMKVPVLTITNTLPEFFWLTNYLETLVSVELWKQITTATTAYEYKKVVTKYAVETGSPLDFALWQCHDFSLRGQSNLNDGASCAGHLVSFLGTDTIPAIDYLEEYYNGLDTFVGGSVPATEHSVMCAGGKDSEIETFRRIITEVCPTGVVSIVSDTWDFWNVITDMAAQLKPEILARTPNAIGLAKVVFRPDSGDPADIICGTKIKAVADTDKAIDILQGDAHAEASDLTAYECGQEEYSGLFRIGDDVCEVTVYPEWNRHDKTFYYIDGWGESTVKKVDLTPEQKGAVECLWDTFGGTVNDSGFKVLNERVGLIYGDSITIQRANDILGRLKDKGFASCNVVFGVGSWSYQGNSTRDTFGFAMKATYAENNGIGQELFKEPKTDDGTKKSARGLLRVEKENGEYVLYDRQTPEQEKQGCLIPVFRDGKLLVDDTLEAIRARLV